jgi:hypothetical protein
MPLGLPESTFPLLRPLLDRFETREVGVTEIEIIPVLHRQGWLRPELEKRFLTLNPANPTHQAFLRLVNDALDLLAAVDRNDFVPGPGWPDLARRLCRALAYLLRGEDVIPDHLPGGLTDDQRELEDWQRRAEAELLRFEAWRAQRG